MSKQNPDFHIAPTKEEDVHECQRIISNAFSSFPVEKRLGNLGEDGVKAAAQRHVRAWREHNEDTGTWPSIRCVHRDSNTGQETTVACAEWFIYPKPIPRNDQRGPGYLLSGIWLSDDERTYLREAFKPTLDLREKWTKDKGYGVLMYMATDPDWRRRGAATICVQWGVERCRELGIPAYLEASTEGVPVYERLGFEIVDEAEMELDGEKESFPVMMWWPPGERNPSL